MHESLRDTLEQSLQVLDRVLPTAEPTLHLEEIGTVIAAGQGVARVSGLPGVRAEELVTFQGGLQGLAFNLDPHEVGIVLLGSSKGASAGTLVRRTGRILDVPVGSHMLGRVIDPLGKPLDEAGPIRSDTRLPVERPAPPIMYRAPVTQPLQTGLKVIDALLPIGKGQRELILGDRQTGKSAIALDTMLNQRDKNVVCVYCAIGQRMSAVAKLIAVLKRADALRYCTIMVASGYSAPGVQFVAPYAATTMAEHFMEQGRDVLIIYDDLTRHARAYRELSLLLRRPPGREAYPGDIFYLHSRLLERSTHLRPEFGGGSLTALPIVETQAQNLSAYIPTNLISITDGQIYLSPDLFHKGIFPAVDVGKSVSRVGGKAQLPCFRTVAGSLRLSYAQFEELEVFARFGTRLDEETRQTLERGRRIRRVLEQPQYQPLPVAEQIVSLHAVIQGLLDTVPVSGIAYAEQAVQQAARKNLPAVCQRMEEGHRLQNEDLEAMEQSTRSTIEALTTS